MAAWRASSGHFPDGYAVTNCSTKPDFYVRNSSPPCVQGLRTRPRLFPPRPGLFLTAAHAAVDCTFGGCSYDSRNYDSLNCKTDCKKIARLAAKPDRTGRGTARRGR